MSEAEDLMSLNAKMTPIIAGLGAIVGDKPAKYSHVIINVSTLGQRGCVRRGDMGAGALEMARRGPHH